MNSAGLSAKPLKKSIKVPDGTAFVGFARVFRNGCCHPTFLMLVSSGVEDGMPVKETTRSAAPPDLVTAIEVTSKIPKRPAIWLPP
jgi:hypothetical protein